MNQYIAEGKRHGYMWGVKIVIDAETIEEANEEAQEQLDEVTRVAGPVAVLPLLEGTSGK